MGILFLKYLFVMLHIVTAAAWFGLALRVAGRARLVLRIEGPAGQAVAEDNHRSVRLMNAFVILTLIFAGAAFFAGGGFDVYGGPYHLSLLLIVVLAAVQFGLIRPASAHLVRAVGTDDVPGGHVRRLAIGTGIGHVLWLLLLVLMYWNRLSVAGGINFGF